jgi:hypothetical protein
MTPYLMTFDRAADAHWRELSQAGNLAMQGGKLEDADAHYRAALDEAERLFDMAHSGCCDAPVAVIQVISRKNLADLLIERKHAKAACRQLESAFCRLATAMEDTLAPFRLRVQSMTQLKFAFLNLVADLRPGSPPV